MKYDKILIAASMAMLVWSCSDDNLPGNPAPTTTGGEVQFGVALDGAAASRTVYGAEDKENNKFPILWENGDEVKVMATTGQRQQGTYKVVFQNPESASQAAAGTLVKQGAGGVQWGDEASANFYSVYPAAQVSDMNVGTRTMTCYLDNNQNDVVSYDATSKTHTAKADMGTGFLYATNYNAANGQSVNLLYKPISTAIRFTVQPPTSGSVTISHIRLQAPANTPIAGKFTVTFPENASDNPTIEIGAVDNQEVFDYITIYSAYESGGFLTLSAGDEPVELNAFIILPYNNTELTIDENWSIQVVTSANTTFLKYLKGNATTSNVLVPGQIHRIKTALPALDGTTTFDKSKWMTYIPRNVYLSEISIPGSWNTLNTDFQDETDLTEQYKLGVRAFHLDCRWKSDKTIGVAAGSASTVRNGDTWNTANGDNITNGASVLSCLQTIAGQVKEQEYLVVICTFAQNSAVPADGSSWTKAITDACNDESVSGKIADASKITSETLVGQVLNKIIVIVNTEDADPAAIEGGSKCFFVSAPMKLKKEMFDPTVSYGKQELHYGDGTHSDLTLFTSHCQVEFVQHGFLGYYNSQGGDDFSTYNRGYLPTPAKRLDQLNLIMDWSQKNYADQDNYTTNHWIYLGLGGYQGAYRDGIVGNVVDVNAVDGSYSTVAKNYSEWINGKISNMSANPTGDKTNFYPVGIVLINYVNAYSSTIENILHLNNKYQKKYNSNEEAWPNTTTGGGDTNGGGDTAGGGDTSSQNKSAGSFSVDTDNWEVF